MPIVRPIKAVDVLPLMEIAQSCGVFTDAEIDLLHEDLREYTGHGAATPDDERLLVAEHDGQAMGLVHFGLAPITDATWYLYWIAVGKGAQNLGLGQALVTAMEKEIRLRNGRLILIETSSLPAFAGPRAFYVKNDYPLVATIPAFYKAGDDKCIFAKKLTP